MSALRAILTCNMRFGEFVVCLHGKTRFRSLGQLAMSAKHYTVAGLNVRTAAGFLHTAESHATMAGEVRGKRLSIFPSVQRNTLFFLFCLGP
jgi:hypothetical protein